MQKFNSVRELSQDLKNTLIEVIALRADFELAMVEQTSPWLVNAPTVDDRLFTAKLVSDELNHGWQLVRLLEEFNVKDRVVKIEEARLGIHMLEVSNLPLFNWEDVIAFVFLVDRAGLYQLRAIKDCSFEPLANLASSMIKEEETHLFFSKNVLKAYQNKNRLQAALNFWFPRALEMLYKVKSLNEVHLRDLNVSELISDKLIEDYVRSTNEEMRNFGFVEVNYDKNLHYNIILK
ncbi:Phenylacetic acid degradation protein paaA [Saccharolobus shibatae B12]|uniref:Phenylacetic acid degradation protein paaA n=1 Tax=Saccharolobus shibatae (strain ATCC 51178 / DSM 5389 / JCM 8931 / NBRC 15437 / B12) TaxID=523848 RepID=A0A8F5GTZ1_SACSH|nr:Phenylacetic acid catabolic protein [Saccharolobus shibatae]QXJ29296.1 Phenylacetic acid degradation protein paaA [Saccharolobus shibatae B12]